MPAQRRLWDSCVIIDYLVGRAGVAESCSNIIEQAERGEIEIVVSALATIEVAYLQGFDDQDSEAKIREFFGRSYIIPAAIDVRVASLARDLIRKYKGGLRLKPLTPHISPRPSNGTYLLSRPRTPICCASIGGKGRRRSRSGDLYTKEPFGCPACNG